MFFISPESILMQRCRSYAIRTVVKFVHLAGSKWGWSENIVCSESLEFFFFFFFPKTGESRAFRSPTEHVVFHSLLPLVLPWEESTFSLRCSPGERVLVSEGILRRHKDNYSHFRPDHVIIGGTVDWGEPTHTREKKNSQRSCKQKAAACKQTIARLSMDNSSTYRATAVLTLRKVTPSHFYW